MGRNLERIEGLFNRPDEDSLSSRKAIGIGELAAVVDDPDVEIDRRSQPGHGLPDMPCADDHQPDPGQRRNPGHPPLHFRPGTFLRGTA